MYRKIIALALLLGAYTMPAQASTFVWKDDVYGFTMSFPDVWSLQTADAPETRLRIAGPIGEDMATCTMEVHKDGRLKIYPKRLMTAVVSQTLDRKFWDSKVGDHKSAHITGFYDPASMGDKGDASAVRLAFLQPDAGGKDVKMYGVKIAGIYGDDMYVGTCSSKMDIYARYASLFGSILDSVMLKDKYHPFATGYYRDFLMDPKLSLPRSKPGTIDPSKSSGWGGSSWSFSGESGETRFNQ